MLKDFLVFFSMDLEVFFLNYFLNIVLNLSFFLGNPFDNSNSSGQGVEPGALADPKHLQKAIKP